jgi:hypothetical protein
VNDSDFVNTNFGSFESTTGNATLPATTAGNTILMVISSHLQPAGAPTGFTLDNVIGTGRLVFCHKSNVGAGETSWTIGPITSQRIAWWVAEVANLDLSSPVDTSSTVVVTSNAATVSTGTTPTSSTYDGIALAAWGLTHATGGSIGTFSGHTNNFTEIDDHGIANGSAAVSLSVARQFVASIATYESTATPSVTTGSATGTGQMVIYTSATAKKHHKIDVMAGMEWGTAAGMGTTGLQSPFDSVAGSPAVVSTNPRSGAYCLELSAAAAVENVAWAASTGALAAYLPSSFDECVARFSIYFPGALPTADVDLFSFEHFTALKGGFIRYRTSGTKLGAQVAGNATTGTEQFSGAVVADQWYDIDVRLDNNATTTDTLSWQVDGVDMTNATGTTTTVNNGVINGVRIGWVNASTATVRYDDIVVSKQPGNYPLGDYRLLPLGPDPAGTLTIGGASAVSTDFNTFTANGTMAAWNATTARDAVDEIPPLIGASATGFAQVVIRSTGYVEVPMATYDAAGNGEAIRALRWYFCGWGAGAPAAATIGFRGWDGTVETTVMSTANPSFNNSTTVPMWMCRMQRVLSSAVPYLWTQTKLDALAARVGFSSDVTPNIGVHAVIAELAVKAAPSSPLFGDLASVAADPDSAGVVQIAVDATTTGDVELYYEETGSPTTVPVTGGTTHTEPIGAIDSTVTNYIALYLPPEPDPVD